jgi:hypothetical protein
MGKKKAEATTPVAPKARGKKTNAALVTTETEFATVIHEVKPPTVEAAETPAVEEGPKKGTPEWALEEGRKLLGDQCRVWISTIDKNGKNFRTPRYRIGVPTASYTAELQTRWSKFKEPDRDTGEDNIMWGVGSNWTGALNFLKTMVAKHPTNIVPTQVAEKIAA